MNYVDHQIERTSLALEANNLQRLTDEQIACIKDPTRHTEAFNMLADLTDRCGVPHEALRPLARAMIVRLGDHLYVREFPAYGPLDFPVPAGFRDTSYHNDVCPSFEGDGYKLFTEFADPELRECDSGGRFMLTIYNPDGDFDGDMVLGGDDMRAEIIPFIDAAKRYNRVQRVWIGQRVLRIKAEILFAVTHNEPLRGGILPVPIDITCFADLHEYCDANCIGDMCEAKVVSDGNVLFPVRTDRTTLSTQGSIEARELVQSTVDNWIRCGSMKRAAQSLK